MEKINYSDIHNETLIDIRSQHAFQSGHIKGSLNLNPGNFKKYIKYFITDDQPIVFIVGKESQSDLELVVVDAEEMGYRNIKGYLIAEEITSDYLKTLETISVKNFLSLADDYILLDTRHPDEITRPAPEKNLINIPFEDLPDENSSLDKNKTIYTLCGSGNRSTAAASYLLTKGFKSKVIEGGMKAIHEFTQ